MVKRAFSLITVVAHAGILVYALVRGVAGFSWTAAGLVLVSTAPLLQRLLKLDSLRVTHHKVRLPRVSLAVFTGLALILLSADKQSDMIWLGFVGVGLFLLDTYWACD